MLESAEAVGSLQLTILKIDLTTIDLHEYIGGPVLIPQTPHYITGSTFPVSMGHEFGGIIEEVGDGVTHLSPGQRAVVRPTIFDGTCSACKQGHKHCCEHIGFIGLSGKAYSVIPRSMHI